MAATSPPPVLCVPYGTDPAPVIIDCLLEPLQQHLPDLTSGVILSPSVAANSHLRRTLTTKIAALGHDACLGPVITTLRDWVNQTVPDSLPVADYRSSELMLVEALHGHADVFGDQDPWQVADSLLPLFDELTLHQIPLPAEAKDFAARLQQAYNIPGPMPSALSKEASIVHHLWIAWREQLQAEGFVDAASSYVHKLQQIPAILGKDSFVVLAGHLLPNPAELVLIQQLINDGRLNIVLQGCPGPSGTHPDAIVTHLFTHLGQTTTETTSLTPYGAVLHAVYPMDGKSLQARAESTRQSFPDSPAPERLKLFAANSAEEEALAIDVQIRHWLLQDIHPIGVVTEDRKLARRLRALLERSGVALNDIGGWALSTTSAAAVVERWLETVEEDFDHQPLLDLLKSPFLSTAEGREAHLLAVYRLEQDLILHENISRGMARYRRHLGYRSKRLQAWSASMREQVESLLDRLETAAAPLLSIQTGLHPAQQYLESFRTSLEMLGLWTALENDQAGQQLLQQWHGLFATVQQRPVELNWLDFRTWLGRCLETSTFKPAGQAGPVQLSTLEQSRMAKFAGVIVAACNQEFLPGHASLSPYFNNRVRSELGLPNRADQLGQQLHDFRRILECAPNTLATWKKQDKGEPQTPSPWLEALQALHVLAYDDDLEDHELRTLLKHPGNQMQSMDSAPLPSPANYPAPAFPTALRPHQLTATSYQTLMDCPYRFFAAHGLSLTAPEAIKTQLEKSDYGERVHQCLEAFHSDVRKLPGPFDGPITPQNKSRAINLLLEISRANFAHDLEDNFMHRGWLKRWEALIPGYIDWQLQHQQHWQVQATELREEVALDSTLSLGGRLDRVDTSEQGCGVIDYKTGVIPKQDSVDQGESVQLPTYALLHQQKVTRVEYLSLDAKKVSAKVSLEGQQLQDMETATMARLKTLVEAMDQSSAMPAWGDDKTCGYCEMDGLCRKEAWEESTSK